MIPSRISPAHKSDMPSCIVVLNFAGNETSNKLKFSDRFVKLVL